MLPFLPTCPCNRVRLEKLLWHILMPRPINTPDGLVHLVQPFARWYCCSLPKSSAGMLDLRCLKNIASTTVKAETPFLQVTRAGAKSLLKRSMDPLSVTSSAYVQLNASTGLDIEKEEDPFPYICILLRYLGSPSHLLTCAFINGNMKSTSSNTLSEQNKRQALGVQFS